MKRRVPARWLLLALGLPWLASAEEARLRQLDPAHATVAAERILSGEFDSRFTTPVPARAVFQHANEPRWFRIDLPADEGVRPRVLSLARVPMHDIRFYARDAAGGWQEQRDSFFRPDLARYAPHAYGFELPAGASTAYLRIEHRGRLYLDAGLQGERAFEKTAQRFVASISVALTALAVMLTINLLFWLRLREPMYASYVAFVGVLMAWTLFATGLVQAWLPPDAGWSPPGSASGLLIAAAYALMLMFVRQYLDLVRRDRFADRLLRALMLAFAGLAALYLLPRASQLPVVAGIASLVFGLMPPVLLYVLLRRGFAGSRTAWLFVVAWLPLGGLSMLRTLAGIGLAPPSPLTLFGPLFAVAFASVVLAVGLAGRALQFRLERDRALQLASVDPLTGALSRRAGEARLASMFGAAQARDWPMSLIFLDVDLLKAINDQYGHQAGDACLRALAGRVKPLLPPRCDLVRWGGDEFLLLLPGCTLDAAEMLGGRILGAVGSEAVEFDGGSLSLGMSLGISALRPDDRSVDALVQRADAALYDAKREGRMRLVRAT